MHLYINFSLILILKSFPFQLKEDKNLDAWAAVIPAFKICSNDYMRSSMFYFCH